MVEVHVRSASDPADIVEDVAVDVPVGRVLIESKSGFANRSSVDPVANIGQTRN